VIVVPVTISQSLTTKQPKKATL